MKESKYIDTKISKNRMKFPTAKLRGIKPGKGGKITGKVSIDSMIKLLSA